VIRDATPDDADAIAAVHIASWRTTYSGIVAQEYIDGLSVMERAAAWTQRLTEGTSPAVATLVAERAPGVLLGFASGGPIRIACAGYDAELYAVYLTREAQRQGLGTQLVRTWAGRAASQGFHAAVVRVLAANPARLFYEHLGARALRTGEIVIGGVAYPETWYAWNDLGALASHPAVR
jgi:L-amino acid N-acyltransferase YncA